MLDEPLANLDYKLREELRVEIPRIFEASGAIFVYATTEPEEALLLGERLLVMAPRPGRIHREYSLPFAEMGVGQDLRSVKRHPDFATRREEILGMIWDMEEEIMGRSVEAGA